MKSRLLFFAVFAYFFLSASTCATLDGAKKDFGNLTGSVSHEKKGDDSRSVPDIRREIDRTCREKYSPPGSADSITQAEYVTCVSNQVFDWMSANKNFRKWILSDCRSRNGKKSHVCTNDDLASTDWGWSLKHEKDEIFLKHVSINFGKTNQVRIRR